MPPSAKRLLRAVAWSVRLTRTHSQRIDELEAWLTRDPENRTAWNRVQTSLKSLDRYATTAELLRLRQGALAHAQAAAQRREHFDSESSAGAR